MSYIRPQYPTRKSLGDTSLFDDIAAGLKKLLTPKYTSDTLCSVIPAGDPYRVPGNYCTQPSGNMIMFNADGTVPPDPFAVATPPSTPTPAKPAPKPPMLTPTPGAGAGAGANISAAWTGLGGTGQLVALAALGGVGWYMLKGGKRKRRKS